MERTRFWNRVGHWFRGGASESARASRGDSRQGFSVTEAGAEPFVVSVGAPSIAAPPVSAPPAQTGRTSEAPGRPPDRENPIGDLAVSVEKHLEAQIGWMEHVADSLDRATASVSSVPDALGKQLDKLTDIHDRVEADLAAMRRIEETLGQLPALADAQREAMVTVDRRLDGLIQSHERGTTALTALQGSLSNLAETSHATIASLERMEAAAAKRDARVAELIEAQTHRLTKVGWSAVGVAGLAFVIALIGLVR